MTPPSNQPAEPVRRTGRVIVVGDIVTDVLAVYSGPLATGTDTDAGITLTAGGSAANTAAWLVSAGVPVTLVGVVGDDAAGADRLAELSDAGVDCAVRRAAGASTGTVVVLSEADERTMLCDRGANGLLSTVDIDTALGDAAGAVHLHLSGYTLFDEASRVAGRYALARGPGPGADHERRRRVRRAAAAGRRRPPSSTGYAGRSCCSPTPTRPSRSPATPTPTG